MNPAGYHATNLVLHILDSLLIWLVLRRLGIPGAYLTALLFAVHPMNVESVAWIAQSKNVLALCFTLISLYSFLQSEKRCQEPFKKVPDTFSIIARWYWFAVIAFTLAMLSKGSVVVLPAVLLLVQGWRNAGITKRDWIRLMPFFALAICFTVVNLCLQARGAKDAIRDVGLLDRLLGAGGGVWFYLLKALGPFDL